MTFAKLIKLWKLDDGSKIATIFWRDVNGKLHEVVASGNGFHSDMVKRLYKKKTNDRWTMLPDSEGKCNIFLEEDKVGD